MTPAIEMCEFISINYPPPPPPPFPPRRGNEVLHVKVQSTEGYYDLYGGPKFGTLVELITYHMQNPGALREKDGKVIELKVPLNREDLASERLKKKKKVTFPFEDASVHYHMLQVVL